MWSMETEVTTGGRLKDDDAITGQVSVWICYVVALVLREALNAAHKRMIYIMFPKNLTLNPDQIFIQLINISVCRKSLAPVANSFLNCSQQALMYHLCVIYFSETVSPALTVSQSV